MIKNWKLFNFKSVKKETELEFAPLTIFAGANSSGKSTLLQSILLVAQTLSNKVGSRSVVLNGALTKLGQFDDLKSIGSDSRQIVLGWTCKPPDISKMGGMRVAVSRRAPTFYGSNRYAMSSVSCEISFDADDSGAQKEVTQLQPQLFSSAVTSVIRDPDGGDHLYSISIRRATTADETLKHKWIQTPDADDNIVRASLQYEVTLDDSSMAEIHEDLVSAEPIGCILLHFLPDRIALGIDLAPETARFIVNALIGEGPRRMLRGPFVGSKGIVPKPVIDYILDVTKKMESQDVRRTVENAFGQRSLLDGDVISMEIFLDGFRKISPRARMEFRRQIAEDVNFENMVTKAIRQEKKQKDDLDVVLSRSPSGIAQACWYADHFFATSVRYLGPLRDEPKPLYPLAAYADPTDVGLRGEMTAAVLNIHRERYIEYIPSAAFSNTPFDPSPVSRTFEAAVTDWLKYLGIANMAYSLDKGKLGHELKISLSEGGPNHDLTHVGVGVSQVLPILVMSLLAEPDTTLIFEQPELHLHPMVQTRLADFFLSIILLGKQCLIETHSEYLINRLRYRAATEGNNNRITNNLKVYFVEKIDGSSNFREVKVNEYGAILDWPEGFFDQSPRESEDILRAAMAKKRKQKKDDGNKSNA